MVAITATNSATPSPQAFMGRTRVDQARREADQAETVAKNLRAQADAAELQSARSTDNLRQLTARVQQEDVTYKPATDDANSEVSPKVQKLIEQMYSATSSARSQSGNPLKSNLLAPPVINVQGQSTGKIVNISA